MFIFQFFNECGNQLLIKFAFVLVSDLNKTFFVKNNQTRKLIKLSGLVLILLIY